jgi:DNA-binding transcriptional MocR family regulator
MKDFLYLQIALPLQQQILKQVLRSGDRLPSLRTICREHGVSQSTALQAYYHLESKGLIESRPQSGYFVSYPARGFLPVPPVSSPGTRTENEHIDLLISKVYHQHAEGNYTHLSLGIPAQELLPVAKLNKELIRAARHLGGSGTAYEKVQGNERLRRQIARRAFGMGSMLSEQDIVITAGCVEAISYALRAVADRNDVIAMESPVSFGMLQLAGHLGLQVMELPTHPQTGIEIPALQKALESQKIKCCLLMSNYSNPLGSCMPDEHKKEVVRLIAKHHVPLIENDVNGELHFTPQRPRTCKSFDRSGLVLWCGSVSKTLAPGYRVGWIAPGMFMEKIKKLKLYHAIASTSITQEAVAGFLETGRYEHHLRKLRHALHANSLHYARAITDHFPDNTMASRPEGGSLLWLALKEKSNTLELYENAMRHRIGFAPGRLFTLQNQFDNCLRLNLALPWTGELQSSLETLGRLAHNLK